jgi:hypothetical protein
MHRTWIPPGHDIQTVLCFDTVLAPGAVPRV